jgi:hypothetical integral membrane protein (TIGR02206 family)
MTGVVTPAAYGATVALGVTLIALALVFARRAPGPWIVIVARALGVLLAADAASFIISLVVQGRFSAKTSLPLALCDMGVIVAAVACWWLVPVLVELTYFWGLAGTLQAIATPDLNVGFPHLVFFQYMAGHLGIVAAALFLVFGVGITPRPKAVPRVFLITAAYTAFVGFVDWVSGANYMFLRSPPSNWTILRLLGPWPWYVLSAAGVALALLTVLDAPFWRGRAAERSRSVQGRDETIDEAGPDLRVAGAVGHPTEDVAPVAKRTDAGGANDPRPARRAEQQSPRRGLSRRRSADGTPDVPRRTAS